MAAVLVLVFGGVNVLRARAATLQCHQYALVQTMPSLVELWLRRFAASARAAHFVFSAGTLFGATTTWWGAGKARRTPHEGVDFGRYAPLIGSAGGGGGAGALRAAATAVVAVQPGCAVPCLCDGAVTCVIRDFICETLVVEHPQLSSRAGGRAGMVLCSLFAHVRAERRQGERVRAGERLCSVAPSPTSGPPPPRAPPPGCRARRAAATPAGSAATRRRAGATPPRRSPRRPRGPRPPARAARRPAASALAAGEPTRGRRTTSPDPPSESSTASQRLRDSSSRNIF